MSALPTPAELSATSPLCAAIFNEWPASKVIRIIDDPAPEPETDPVQLAEPPHDPIAETVRIATHLARKYGWSVFPCRGEDKRPATPHGFKDAVSDPELIAELWCRYPAPLIGIATGAVSGIDVLDIDSARHEQARAWWEAARKRISIPTRVYRTRSGGLHVYFKHAARVGNTASKLAKGVDTRGDGGYAIFWPALGYECLDRTAPAPWPTWLLECVLWQPPPPPPRSAVRLAEHSDKAIQGIVRVVASAAEGSRNTVLYWGAQRLKERMQGGQISQSEATTLLLTASRATGLPDFEASRTIASAWRAM
jgi:hypothetical protein